MASTYAIGDVQGCGHALAMLLDQIHHAEPDAHIVFVGDLVNRGPSSLDTLRLIKGLGERASVVLGNHDLHLLAAAHHVRKPHALDTLEDVLAAPDRDALLDWLRHQPLATMREGCLVVHAGLLPQWSAQQAVALSREVEAVLQGEHWIDFLHQMYGNQPDLWDEALTGVDRLRCIINAMTRLRFCDLQGRMEFQSKEGLDAAPPGFRPWFEIPGRKSAGTTIVCGHWSTLGLMQLEDVVALDTGCVWGGKLTAMRLSDRSVLQVDCPQYQQPG